MAGGARRESFAVQSLPWATTLLFGGAAAGVIALHMATNPCSVSTLMSSTTWIAVATRTGLRRLSAGRTAAGSTRDGPPRNHALEAATLMGGCMVALSGSYVRKLGGSLRLQAIALLIARLAPYFLGDVR
jgi:hypothetical protein